MSKRTYPDDEGGTTPVTDYLQGLSALRFGLFV